VSSRQALLALPRGMVPYGQVGGDQVTARVDPRMNVSPADRIRLGLDMRGLHFFDADNELALLFRPSVDGTCLGIIACGPPCKADIRNLISSLNVKVVACAAENSNPGGWRNNCSAAARHRPRLLH
jgi:hypothetical protein